MLTKKILSVQTYQNNSKCPHLSLFVQPTPGKFQSTSQKTDMKIPTTLLSAFSLPYPIVFPIPQYKYTPPPPVQVHPTPPPQYKYTPPPKLFPSPQCHSYPPHPTSLIPPPLYIEVEPSYNWPSLFLINKGSMLSTCNSYLVSKFCHLQLSFQSCRLQSNFNWESLGSRSEWFHLL